MSNSTLVGDMASSVEFVEGHKRVRLTGIRQATRNRLAKQYVLARSQGQDHEAARRRTIEECGLAPVWVYLMWFGLQVIFALLREWWEEWRA